MNKEQNGMKAQPFRSRLVHYVFQLSILFCIVLMVTNWIDEIFPIREFTTRDLIIPFKLLPPTMEVSPAGVLPMGANIGYGNEDDSYVSFKTVSDRYIVADQFVFEFKNDREAGRWYEREFQSEFNDNSIAVSGSWTKPDNWTFESQLALKSHVACNINNVVGEKLVCKYMAQYAEFVVNFWSIIRSDTMDILQFERLVQEIDLIMVAHLQE